MFVTRIGFNGINYYISTHDVTKETAKCIYAKIAHIYDTRRIYKYELNTVLHRSNGTEDYGLIWATGETEKESKNKACNIYISFLKQKISEIEKREVLK